MVSMHWGISSSWLAGVALYACAALLWPSLARSLPADAHEARTG
jgi:hypothetical protein